MRKFLILLLAFAMTLFFCSCENRENKPETSRSDNSEYVSDGKELWIDAYRDEILNKGKGYIDISDDEFLEKSKKVTVEFFPDDLEEVFGVEPGEVEELGVDRFYCFNDNYFLMVTRGAFVILYNISEPTQYEIIDTTV